MKALRNLACRPQSITASYRGNSECFLLLGHSEGLGIVRSSQTHFGRTSLNLAVTASQRICQVSPSVGKEGARECMFHTERRKDSDAAQLQAFRNTGPSLDTFLKFY